MILFLFLFCSTSVCNSQRPQFNYWKLVPKLLFATGLYYQRLNIYLMHNCKRWQEWGFYDAIRPQQQHTPSISIEEIIVRYSIYALSQNDFASSRFVELETTCNRPLSGLCVLRMNHAWIRLRFVVGQDTVYDRSN